MDSTWYLIALGPAALLVEPGGFLPPLMVVAAAFGIFFGTLSLGRAPRAAESPARPH
ncbi:MAG: hypothetical protein IT376_00995 [Polyangiaceae bacterium]|nr:hypothetical protein [Polyangiaceae bacterium]